MKGASLIAPFGLRMPEELKEKIAERAKKNGRSMNAEIVQILHDAIDGEFSLDMNEDLGRAYNQLISPETYPATQEQFDKYNEMLDWLIDELAEKIERDSVNMRSLLNMRKESNKKPT